jgi:hypothetical protein
MHAGKTLKRPGATPSCRKIAARSLRASGSLPPLSAASRRSSFARAGEWNERILYDSVYDKTNEEERNENMAIIKAPPKQPKAVTIQARVEESVKAQLDQYAKFIDSTPSYVITEALKVLFKRDEEFKGWLGQQPNTGNNSESQGGAQKQTA